MSVPKPEQDSLDTRRCVGCGATAPSTDTNYTLISSRHGWRLTRAKSEGGVRVMEWRCPKCWDLYKRRLR